MRHTVKGLRLAVAFGLTGTILMFSCSKSNPTNVAEATWSFTVNVVDGSSGSKIANARVSYKNSSARDTFGLTNSQGQVTIEGLLAGVQNFKVTFPDTASMKYTEVFLTKMSIADSSGLKKLADQLMTVKLFPLSGSFSGKIVSQLHVLAPKVPASGVTMSVSFSNPDLDSAKIFQATTNSDGSFQCTGLPVAAGIKIKIPNTSVSGVSYVADSFAMPVLQSKNDIPLGTIYLHPIDSKNLKLTKELPKSLSPNQVIILTYSDSLDTFSYATFEGVGGLQTVNANRSIKGAQLSFTPSISLVDSGSYCLTVYAFGKTGGTLISKDTLKVLGSGLVDVVSSNVLDANHRAIDGLGLSDSMYFTFRSAIARGSATITLGETVVLTDVAKHDSTLVIKPKGSWESGTYTVKIAVTLSDSTTSSFTFKITTVGGLDFVSSNIYNPQTKTAINGLGVKDTITVVANKTLSSAQATLSIANPSAPVNVKVTVSGATVIIVPVDILRYATAYSFNITVTTEKGESKSFSIPSTAPFTTASSNFYPVTDNIRNSGDPTKPVLNFAPNGTIFIKMSMAVKSATAQIISDSGAVSATVKKSADSIMITPAANLNEGIGYSLKVSAESNSGVIFSDTNFVSHFYIKNTFVPKTSNVRMNSDPKQPVLDFSPGGVIVIVMTDTVQSATAALLNGGTTVGAVVKVNKDTVKIIPNDQLSPAVSYDLSLGVQSVTGLTFQAKVAPYFVTGLRVQVNQVRVVASNVLSGDGLGLTNIPVTITPFYVLSMAPDPQSLAITLFSGDTAKTTISTKGDTVFVKPVINLTPGKQYKVLIKGKTAQNDPIDIDLTGTNRVFSTRIAVIVVASNMLEANGKSVNNLQPSTELWVKFSRALSTDLTKMQLGGGPGKTITYKNGATNNNAAVRVSNDTLFAKFLSNALPGEGDTVSLRGQSILFEDGSTLGADAVDIKAFIQKKATPYVIATNGIVSNTVVDTFGLLAEAWIVSSLSFRSVDAIKNGPDGLSNVSAQNLLLSNVRTHGDTIFFKPAVKLNYATEYQVAFNVTLSDSSKYTGSNMKLRWKTEQGIYLISANDMASGTTYRPFSLTGDSLVLTFSKPVNITKTFTIGGFVSKLNYSWSGNTKVTVKPLDTLKAKPYSWNPGYSITDTAQYGAITITLTSEEGEIWTAKATNVVSIFNNARPGLAVFSALGIEVLNTSLKVSSANKSLPYENTDNKKLSDLVAANFVAQNDSVGIGDTLKVYFSAAVDSAAEAKTPNMVRLLSGTTSQNISISYASAHKIMLIKPSALLATAATYTLSLTNVRELGAAANDPNGDISYSLAFKTRPIKPLSTAQVQLIAEPAATSGVQDKRKAYSGSKSNAYGTTGTLNPTDVPLVNTVEIMYYEIAFHSALSLDTVSHYQVSVKGYNGTWYDLRRLLPAVHYTTSNDSLRHHVINLSDVSVNDTDVNGVKVGPLLRIATKPNSQNDPNIFNYGAQLQVRIRPVLSANDRWSNGDQAGAWSATTLTFQDNVTPCDTDFVASSTDLSRLQMVNRGGVSVTVTGCPMNRTSLNDSQYVFVVVFPEDMDTTMKPTITTWYGGTPPTTGIGVDNAASGWTNAYTCKMVVTIPGTVNWTDASKLPYYAISVAAMRDASGQVIQTWGKAAGVNGTPAGSVAAADNKKGTLNLTGLTLY